MSISSQLDVAENFFGNELESPSKVKSDFYALSSQQQKDLAKEFSRFERAWVPEEDSNQPIFHIGQSYDVTKRPNYWTPHDFVKTIENDVDSILRLLIFLPKIYVWSPSWSDPRFLGRKLGSLAKLKPFLKDGSIRIVPDAAIPFKNIPNSVRKIAAEDASIRSIRKLLDKIEFFDRENCEDYSDGEFLFFHRHRENFQYINPMTYLYFDILVSAYLRANVMSSGTVSHSLISRKHKADASVTDEMQWDNVSVYLPGISKIDVTDLASIRQNEDAFDLWRTSLASVIRESQAMIESGTATPKRMRNLFKSETQPIALTLGDKIKSKNLRQIVEPGAVSFLSGAVASTLLSASPETAMATGAISSLVKISYDLLRSRKNWQNKQLLRMYTALAKIDP